MRRYINNYMSKFTLHGPSKVEDNLYNEDEQGKAISAKDKDGSVIIDPSTLKEAESLTLDYPMFLKAIASREMEGLPSNPKKLILSKYDPDIH